MQNDERICDHCGSSKLFTDWTQGDLICTNCGVVIEEKLRDTRPEWKDFNDDADLAKGLPNSARCGLVPTNESRYVGGLQPTSYSRHVFGGAYGAGVGSSRCSSINNVRRLLRTNHKIDKMIEKIEGDKLKEAQMAREIMIKRRKERKEIKIETTKDASLPDGVTSSSNAMVVTEEDEAADDVDADAESSFNRLNVFNNEKWSIDRAIVLHGGPNDCCGGQIMRDQEQRSLLKRMNKAENIASLDVFQAYKIMQNANAKLSLPDKVIVECTNFMCQYAARRNGFHVKGVKSNVKFDYDANGTDRAKQEATEKQQISREVNKVRQMSALAAALMYVCGKKLGHSNSLADVCHSFSNGDDVIKKEVGASSSGSKNPIENVIKPKHCSKAIAELKIEFPHIFKLSTYLGMKKETQNSVENTTSLVHRMTKSLSLPDLVSGVTCAMIDHYVKEQFNQGTLSEKKFSTMCVSMIYLVCIAGSTMQRLACQTLKSEKLECKRKAQMEYCSFGNVSLKRVKQDSISFMKGKGLNASKRVHTTEMNVADTKPTPEVQASISNSGKRKAEEMLEPEDCFDQLDNFDADLAYSSVDASKCSLNPTQNVNSLRGWQTWSEQKSWNRDLILIEKSACISRRMIHNFCSKNLFPRRAELLERGQEWLQKEAESGCGSYMANLTTAASIMVLGKP